MTFDDLKSRLRNVKEHGQYKITASCPCGSKHSHNDKARSFSATYDSSSGKILVYCHTGCSFDAICEALGCGKEELMPEPTEQERQRSFLEWYADKNALRLEAVYSYCYGPFTDGLAKARFRAGDGKKDFRWIKTDSSQKSGFRMTHNGCPHRLYVRGDLQAASRCFLVEGEKDADTLFTLTRTPTASAENGATKGGSAGGKWLAEYTQQLEGKDVYILGDNDEAGRNFAEIVAQALEGHAARLFMLDITEVWPDCPEKGDITDMAQALGGEETVLRLRDLIQKTPERAHSAQEAPQQAPGDLDGEQEAPAQEAPQGAPERPQNTTQTAAAPARSSVELFDLFMQKVQTDAYKPIPTGMPAFDRLLRGGIPKQALIMLSAAPGTGKTSLTQQIFETAATHGTDVIFFNLEMSREQLLARSISRMVHANGGSISAGDVMRGYSWTDAQRRFIEAAAAKYRAEIAPHLQYNPDGSGAYISAIITTLEKAAQAAKAAGKPAPVCVLDYLHLIRAEPGQRADQQEIIKGAVEALKGWAIKYDSYVFAISANNRAANNRGVTSLADGRDTSAIEYTGDIVLALNFRELHEGKADARNPDDMERLQSAPQWRMMVQVLKNRMNGLAKTGAKLYLAFDAANSTFTAETDQTPPPASLRQMGFTDINDPDLPDF